MPEGRQPAPDEKDEEVRVPTLREEMRSAARYGIAGQWAAKRRQRIAAELERNRRGDHKVPTWVLAVILVAFVAGWVLLIVLS